MSVVTFDSQNRKPPIPAATVAFIRDRNGAIEVYLNRRPRHFRYYPGAFVFPGGRCDPGDQDVRATACREVKEEIGIEIDPERLVRLRETHTSPHAGPVYHMVIFAYPVNGEFPTRINADEIEEEVWATPAEALARLELPYQIMAALEMIAQFGSTEELLRALSRRRI